MDNTLRIKTFNVCRKILDPKYKWLTYRHWGGDYPPFKLPDDPKKDIEEALALKDEVYKKSKGMDGGECCFAAPFKDDGVKLYRSNINHLRAMREDWPSYLERPCDADIDLALDRWEWLEKASYECMVMMKKLIHNNDKEF